MEKYGVHETAPKEKLAEAQTAKQCPQCGYTLYDPTETGVLSCPKCGTKPFEEE